MAYTALYRKFRPQRFDDVSGQEHIVTTLKNQINTGRMGHAYLFCGTRGTGKTTIAKIFARAVNCESPIDGSPCGECPTCRSIAEGKSLNVVEIDAASNNSVENVRQIIEEVAYPPVEGKYKVYIMDEAHMLTEGARNALLKTLEEPPSYVIFILATTEVHRIPITIMSRCQRYDFKRIAIDVIAARMKQLTDEEGIEVEDKALTYVAKAADGSMRDGLSLLDQCIAFEFGHKLTYDKVLDILGAVDSSVFERFLDHLLEDDVRGSMALIEEVVMQGRDLSQFVTDFIWHLRNLMLLKNSDDGDMENLLNVSTERLESMKAQAAKLEMNTIFRYIDVFTELSSRMKYSSQKRITIEMYVIRLLRPQMDTDNDALLERIRRLEKLTEKIENGEIGVRTAQAVSTRVKEEKPVEKVQLTRAVPEDIQRVVREWPVIVGKTDNLFRPIMKQAELSMGENEKLLICLPDSAPDSMIRDEEIRQRVSDIINEHIEKDVPMEFKKYSSNKAFGEQYADLKEILHVEYLEEE